MSEAMSAYVLHGPKDFRRDERPIPKPGPGEVLIAVHRAGVCGSDVHYYREFQIGQFIPQHPLILGHEFAGAVEAVGSGVHGFRSGDRVTVEPSLECGTCRFCRAGRYNLCERMRFIGTAATVPHIDGAFAEHVIAPASHCYLLPDAVSYGLGALVEPLAVGANAVSRAGSLFGQSVLVTGAGAIGQAVVLSAALAGASVVYVSDPDEYSRQIAVAGGAAGGVDPRDHDAVSAMRAEVGGGFDVVFEASGVPAALVGAYEMVDRGGTIVQIGTQPAEVPLPANLVMTKELSVIGSFRYAQVFGPVVDALGTGRLRADHLITAVYPFDELPEAVERASGRDLVVKVQVEFFPT